LRQYLMKKVIGHSGLDALFRFADTRFFATW
jgi:hypothetical protein